MQPTERVTRFIRDFAKAWQDIDGDGAELFDRWREAVRELEAAHFVEGVRSELDRSFASPCPHLPELEVVLQEARRGEGRVVETQADEEFHEYALQAEGEDWRIAGLRTFLQPPDRPLLHDAARARLSASAADAPLHDVARPVSLQRWFAGDAEVHALGRLVLTSGAVVVGDLGYGARTLHALARSAPVGAWPVELAEGDEGPVALRVVFADGDVAGWKEGRCGDRGHRVGVSAGNLAVLDGGALRERKARDHERLFLDFIDEPGPLGARMLEQVQPGDGVAVEVAGDGERALYWAVDADGALLALYVDLLA